MNLPHCETFFERLHWLTKTKISFFKIKSNAKYTCIDLMYFYKTLNAVFDNLFFLEEFIIRGNFYGK